MAIAARNCALQRCNCVAKAADMKATIIRRPEKLRNDRRFLSPPVIEEPLYQCAVSVTVLSYEPHATIDVNVNGTVTTVPGGFPFPNGVTIGLTSALIVGQKVKARQRRPGAVSAWTVPITVRDHTQDYP